MARPPKSEKMGYMLRVRMFDEDRALMEQAAKLAGLELSTWARTQLIALARKALKQDAGGHQRGPHQSKTKPNVS
jgi:uncharacterized protein (DUF1778 family)